LRRWLRNAENLSDTEEEVVYICEPKVGRNLHDEEERSIKDLVDCQEGRDELLDCQVGNKKRSSKDLIDCQEGRDESSDWKMRLFESLLDLVESSDQPGALT
jgi:hypothetical protein